MEKFKAVSQDIANKQKMYMEVAEKRMSTVSDLEGGNYAAAGPNQ